MASIQFYGKDNVIQAYKNCDIPAWGLFDGKRLICRYCDEDINAGAELLDEFLSKFEGSTATYTLKVYELKKGEKIKEKTDCDSSFNFKIDNYGDLQQRQSNFTNQTLGVVQVLDRISQRLDKLEAPDPLEEEEEEEESLMDSIGAAIKESVIGAIKNPSEDNLIIKLISSITGKNSNTIQADFKKMQYPAAVGNINQTNKPMPETSTETYEEQVKRLSDAITILQEHDPKIVDHLEKLARLAQSNPSKFQGLISMLKFL